MYWLLMKIVDVLYRNYMNGQRYPTLSRTRFQHLIVGLYRGSLVDLDIAGLDARSPFVTAWLKYLAHR